MDLQSAGLTIIAALLSGLVGVLISTLYYRRYENRRTKLDHLRKLLAHRFRLAGGPQAAPDDAFFVALNEAFVVFHDARPVLDASEALHSELQIPGRANENLVRLFKAMFRHLGIDHSVFNESFFLSPFAPGRINIPPKQ